MSKYFCLDPRTKKYENIVWRRRGYGLKGRTLVYLGDRTIGELFGPDRQGGWSAVSHAQGTELRGLRLVAGFRTRWDATDYLLNVGVREQETLGG